jgi:hypothetical protein
MIGSKTFFGKVACPSLDLSNAWTSVELCVFLGSKCLYRRMSYTRCTAGKDNQLLEQAAQGPCCISPEHSGATEPMAPVWYT